MEEGIVNHLLVATVGIRLVMSAVSRPVDGVVLGFQFLDIRQIERAMNVIIDKQRVEEVSLIIRRRQQDTVATICQRQQGVLIDIFVVIA